MQTDRETKFKINRYAKWERAAPLDANGRQSVMETTTSEKHIRLVQGRQRCSGVTSARCIYHAHEFCWGQMGVGDTSMVVAGGMV
jgi:hypothetical protein